MQVECSTVDKQVITVIRHKGGLSFVKYCVKIGTAKSYECDAVARQYVERSSPRQVISHLQGLSDEEYGRRTKFKRAWR